MSLIRADSSEVVEPRRLPKLEVGVVFVLVSIGPVGSGVSRIDRASSIRAINFVRPSSKTTFSEFANAVVLVGSVGVE